MKSTLHSVDVLCRLPLFTFLGLAIFLGGCSEKIRLREESVFNSEVSLSREKYTGPQNARELMKALDGDYNRGLSKIKVSVSHKVTGIKIKSYSSKLTAKEIDTRYPRAEWLQLLLDRGITIENFHAYSAYLLKRHTLALLEDNPNLRQKILNIPSIDNWETYKEAYINKLVKDHTKNRKNL